MNLKANTRKTVTLIVRPDYRSYDWQNGEWEEKETLPLDTPQERRASYLLCEAYARQGYSVRRRVEVNDPDGGAR